LYLELSGGAMVHGHAHLSSECYLYADDSNFIGSGTTRKHTEKSLSVFFHVLPWLFPVGLRLGLSRHAPI